MVLGFLGFWIFGFSAQPGPGWAGLAGLDRDGLSHYFRIFGFFGLFGFLDFLNFWVFWSFWSRLARPSSAQLSLARPRLRPAQPGPAQLGPAQPSLDRGGLG